MEPKEVQFQPKAFYRKFDSLLAQIGKASAKDLNSLVLDELAQTFGADLKIQSGCLYRRKGGSYEKIKGPVGASLEPWHRWLTLLLPVPGWCFLNLVRLRKASRG